MPEGSSQTAYTSPARLWDTVQSIQVHQHSLSIYLEQLAQRIEDVDPYVRAFLPESDRRQRLRRDADALRSGYPDPLQRPVL